MPGLVFSSCGSALFSFLDASVAWGVLPAVSFLEIVLLWRPVLSVRLPSLLLTPCHLARYACGIFSMLCLGLRLNWFCPVRCVVALIALLFSVLSSGLAPVLVLGRLLSLPSVLSCRGAIEKERKSKKLPPAPLLLRVKWPCITMPQGSSGLPIFAHIRITAFQRFSRYSGSVPAWTSE